MDVVLFQPEIPQNTGNIARTCVATDSKLWLVRPLGFQLDEKRLRRAGLDYWQHLEVEVVDSWEHFLEQTPSERVWFFSRFATNSFSEVTYQKGDCLVFGSESNGLPASVMQNEKERLLRIPTHENVRSLNLSCAVAVAGYEAVRGLNG